MGHVDHLSGHPDHMLIFCATFNVTFIFHLMGQEAFFVSSLTPDKLCITHKEEERLRELIAVKPPGFAED